METVKQKPENRAVLLADLKFKQYLISKEWTAKGFCEVKVKKILYMSGSSFIKSGELKVK